MSLVGSGILRCVNDVRFESLGQAFLKGSLLVFKKVGSSILKTDWPLRN